MKNGMLKRITALLLATTLFVTPVFRPADMSFLGKIRTNAYNAGREIGSNVKVNVDVSQIINNIKYPH